MLGRNDRGHYKLRTKVVLRLATAILGVGLSTTGWAEVRSYDALVERARSLADKDFQPADVAMPPSLEELDYDAYRDIRFRPERAIWRDTELPVELQLLHLGLYYDTPIALNLITQDGVEAVPFDPALFDYGRNEAPEEIPEDFSFSGFRLHYPLNAPDYKDELIVFQGASYFRALGRGQQYGLSARGLAIDTAEPSGEEFPAFREFWIEWPRKDATSFRILALLDSPSVTGAYAFEVTPGDTTRTKVEAKLFPRQAIDKLGVAPLTSMYYYGEATPRPPKDFRPEVHDSDGLLVHADDEWLWRPLRNPDELTANAFSSEHLQGFGLMQRDRDHASYQDLEADYQRRPSAWVEPHGDWGAGHIELIQIPASNEVNDNIVAFWVPERAVTPEAPLSFAYTIHWEHARLSGPELATVRATRLARPEGDEKARHFIIDFAGGPLAGLAPDAEIRREFSHSGNFEAEEVQTMHNPHTGGWRAVIKGRPRDDAQEQAIELRLQLRDADDEALSEVWSYSIDPS
ncbi:glucan biosynthesis protein G [Algiphilus aromaticivorans]|uniref:glucan biosynthesis protein G n=1 Tax=Algiphilus aromaticivorans TaxID=382454 RepID=UPI0005C1C0CC|nr:glucan biosynthesis protein G [Algiphilus aromaticivorans]